MIIRVLSSLSIIFLFYSCSKNNDSILLLEGNWVEKTLRLDTFDFEKGKTFYSAGANATVYFSSKPFNDPSLNPNYPINNSTYFSYYFKSDSIFLRSFLSSSIFFQSYRFQLSSDQKSFQVGKFYTRTGLVASMLEFEKIQ